MLSSGGNTSTRTASEFPIRLVESGPAAGAIAASHFGLTAHRPNLISFDMGGTTAKVSIVRDGQLDIAEGYWIGGEELGYPLQLPVVDVVEIGAGGGSIAHIDEVGALKIGTLDYTHNRNARLVRVACRYLPIWPSGRAPSANIIKIRLVVLRITAARNVLLE